MGFSTFCIEKPPNSKVQTTETFAGKRVLNNNSEELYHSIYSDDDIKALRIHKNENTEVLKEGESEICEVKERLDWRTKYEIQVYGLKISNSNENYIIIDGWLNDHIFIEDAEEVKLEIAGTPMVIKFDYEKYYGWHCKADKSSCSYMKCYPSDTDITKSFGPNTELLRVGFEEHHPEAVDAIYP
jgi:hypothetical protein